MYENMRDLPDGTLDTFASLYPDTKNRSPVIKYLFEIQYNKFIIFILIRMKHLL